MYITVSNDHLNRNFQYLEGLAPSSSLTEVKFLIDWLTETLQDYLKRNVS